MCALLLPPPPPAPSPSTQLAAGAVRAPRAPRPAPPARPVALPLPRPGAPVALQRGAAAPRAAGRAAAAQRHAADVRHGACPPPPPPPPPHPTPTPCAPLKQGPGVVTMVLRRPVWLPSPQPLAQLARPRSMLISTHKHRASQAEPCAAWHSVRRCDHCEATMPLRHRTTVPHLPPLADLRLASPPPPLQLCPSLPRTAPAPLSLPSVPPPRPRPALSPTLCVLDDDAHGRAGALLPGHGRVPHQCPPGRHHGPRGRRPSGGAAPAAAPGVLGDQGLGRHEGEGVRGCSVHTVLQYGMVCGTVQHM